MIPAGKVAHIQISPGGLPKTAIARAVVGPLGIEGDGHRHSHIHGGPRKALLLLAREALDELAARGYPLFPGALGENLTTEGLDHRTLRAGQRYRIGSDVFIELTEPRGPCSALDRYGSGLKDAVYDSRVKAGDSGSPKWGMSGFYAAVLREGVIEAGAPVFLVAAAA